MRRRERTRRIAVHDHAGAKGSIAPIRCDEAAISNVTRQDPHRKLELLI
jgi:hypothetical protein